MWKLPGFREGDKRETEFAKLLTELEREVANIKKYLPSLSSSHSKLKVDAKFLASEQEDMGSAFSALAGSEEASKRIQALDEIKASLTRISQLLNGYGGKTGWQHERVGNIYQNFQSSIIGRPVSDILFLVEQVLEELKSLPKNE